VNIESRTSLRDLVGEVADDARVLVRGEIALARSEFEHKVERVVTGVVSLVGAMLLAYAGLIIVLIAAAQALARSVPDWAASLIIGGVVLVIGLVMALIARRALSPSAMVPERTIRNVQADARVAKEHVS
jgi:hypothetical protein